MRELRPLTGDPMPGPATLRMIALHRFDLFTEEDLATLVGVTTNTLQTWRVAGTGPDYVKLGKAILYRYRDIERWIEESVVAREPGRVSVI